MTRKKGLNGSGVTSNSMLIGNKNDFGIEYNESKSNLGLVRLWLNSNQIGSFQENEIFTAIHHQLSSLLIRRLPHRNNFENKNLTKVFELIKNDDTGQFDVTMLDIGSSFDDFIIRVITDNNSILMAWELIENPFFDYDIGTLKSDIARVNLHTFESVLTQFLDSIQNPNSN